MNTTVFLIFILIALPLVVLLIDSGFRLLYLLSTFRSEAHVNVDESNFRLAFVIVANNEAGTIREVIEHIKSDINKKSSIFVIADHCSDGTASIAQEAGAIIYSRDENKLGKGFALSWFAKAASDELTQHDAVIILDADSLIQQGFSQAICRRLSGGSQVIQAFLYPITSIDSPRNCVGSAQLASYSELLSEVIDDHCRSLLKWSVPIRGTGVVFRTDLFFQHAGRLRTQVEDIEFSLQLSHQNIRIDFEPEAILLDPKTPHITGLARQRGRWLKGQRQVWKLYHRQIGQMLLRGPSQWSLIQALLLKPKTFFLLLKFVIAMLFTTVYPTNTANIHITLCLLIYFAILIDLLYYIFGLFYIPDSRRYVKALLQSPVYLVIWLYSWSYSIQAGKTWLSARKY